MEAVHRGDVDSLRDLVKQSLAEVQRRRSLVSSYLQHEIGMRPITAQLITDMLPVDDDWQHEEAFRFFFFVHTSEDRAWPDARHIYANFALMVAVDHGDIDMVRLLVEFPDIYDVNLRRHGVPSCHVSTDCGNF